MATKAVYDYSILDLAHGLEESLLQRQILDADLGQTLLDVARKDETLEITFETAIVSEATLATVVAAHDPTGFVFESKYLEEEYWGSKIARRTWFSRKEAGAYKYRVEETLFTYQGASLVQEVWTQYNLSGSAIRARTWEYMTVTGGGLTTIRKEEV
jgi:hypothetical protein